MNRLSLKHKIHIISESEKTGLSARKWPEKLVIGSIQITAMIDKQ